VTEAFWLRKTVTIASVLFLLVLSPGHSQISTPSQTPLRRNPQMLDEDRTPASRTDAIASPTPPTRPPRTYNLATPTPAPPRPPPRTYNIASPTPPATRTYNTASPPPARRPTHRENITSPAPPRRPLRRYNTASPITATRPPRREDTTSLITPTQPPRQDNTEILTTPTPSRLQIPAPPPNTENIVSPAIHIRPPFPDIITSPAIRLRTPIPDLTASPTIRLRSPVPDITASPTVYFRPPVPPITARATNQPTLNVSPSPPVEIGKPVLFEVVLWQPPPPGWNLQYRFDFGDGTRTDWKSERQATHTYLSPGNGSYPVHVEIVTTRRDGAQSTKEINGNVQVVTRSSLIPTSTATSVPITPSPTPYPPSPSALPTATPISPPLEVYLSVDKNPTSAGDSVIFSIATNLTARNQHYLYEIDFGDGSKLLRTNSNSVPHVFKTAGNYTASVKVLDGGTQAHSDLAIFVDARRSPWLWVYIFVGLAVLALAYSIFQRSKPKVAMAARPTFHPHSDWEAPRTPPKNVAINYELLFRPNVSASQDRLETGGASSILRKKKQ
jgi:PKD domain